MYEWGWRGGPEFVSGQTVAMGAKRDELKGLLGAGKRQARKLKRADLARADAGATDEDIAISVGFPGSTVYRTKRRLRAR
jgi:hypothetical protein